MLNQQEAATWGSSLFSFYGVHVDKQFRNGIPAAPGQGFAGFRRHPDGEGAFLPGSCHVQEVNRHFRFRVIGNVPGQSGNVGGRRAHAGQTDAGAVAEKDFRERFRNDGFDAGAPDRLRGMLTGGTAAEVGAAQNDGSPFEAGIVHRVGFGLSVFVEAFVPEHDSRQFVKRDAFKEAGGDDAVRVHVRSRNGNAGAGDGGELGQRHKGKNWKVNSGRTLRGHRRLSRSEQRRPPWPGSSAGCVRWDFPAGP